MKRDQFWQAYYRELVKSIEASPQKYALIESEGETAQGYASRTAAKMQQAVEREKNFGAVNYRDSQAFRAAAKEVGVPFTREGLNSIYKEGE